MDAWVFWTIAAMGLAAGEIFTGGFFLAPFAGGAALAALFAAGGAGDVLTWAVFVGGSVLALAFLRPVARRHLRTPPQIRTGTAALVGKQAIVLERIVNREGVGSVKLEGEVWTARALDDEGEIEAGTQVQVIEIRGATALVTE